MKNAHRRLFLVNTIFLVCMISFCYIGNAGLFGMLLIFLQGGLFLMDTMAYIKYIKYKDWTLCEDGIHPEEFGYYYVLLRVGVAQYNTLCIEFSACGWMLNMDIPDGKIVAFKNFLAHKDMPVKMIKEIEEFYQDK